MEIFSLDEMRKEQEVVYTLFLGRCLGKHEATGETCVASQSCSVATLSLILQPMNCSVLDFSVFHYFPEFAEAHVHCISDAIQPSHPLMLPSPPALNLSQLQGLSQCQLFASSSQSIGASASVLPVNIQGWFPLGLSGLISLQSKGLSRVFSTTTVWKHQFFGVQAFLWFNSHICTRLLEKL